MSESGEEQSGEDMPAEASAASEANGNGNSHDDGDHVVSDDVVESVGAEDAMEEVPERRKSRVRQYKIQEVIKRRQVLLVQVVKEERGNKGAALTTYLSLAGRYSVLMPNTARGGGISRKITSITDRKRLKQVVSDLEVPPGMGVILRTAGASRPGRRRCWSVRCACARRPTAWSRRAPSSTTGGGRGRWSFAWRGRTVAGGALGWNGCDRCWDRCCQWPANGPCAWPARPDGALPGWRSGPPRRRRRHDPRRGG